MSLSRRYRVHSSHRLLPASPACVALLSLLSACNSGPTPRASSHEEPPATALPATEPGPAVADEHPHPAEEGAEAPAAPPTAADSPNRAAPPLAGIAWDSPPGFERSPAQHPMRAAEYILQTDGGPLSLVAYHFPGMGGSVNDNIERWKGQFDEAAREAAQVESSEVRGLSLTTLDISGSNAGMHIGPRPEGGSDDAAAPAQRMLGAVVEAPGGLVFFKLVGPAAAVEGALPGYRSFLASLRPAPAPSPSE